MAAIILSTLFPSGTVTANYQFAQNQTYIIDSEFTLSGTNTFKSGCILIFQGGCFKGSSSNPAVLKFAGCKIEGSGVIFKGDDISFLDTSSYTNKLYNTALLAEWFGALPSSSDVSGAINKALRACYASNVHTLLFCSGSFTVNNPVYIGEETTGTSSYNTRFWDIKIVGAGNYYSRGTAFILGENGQFIVDMVNRNIGTQRSGGIYECHFYGGSTQVANAILVKKAQTFEIRRCMFVLLNKAIELTGACYYVDIRTCIFDHCAYGVKSTNHETDSTPNNDMIYGCMFAHCDNPADLVEGHCWHIMDCDFENYNGTIKLCNNARLTNVRIENNNVDVPWLEIPDNCEVDAEIHQGSSGDGDTWRCVCTGNGNRVRLRVGFVVKYGLVSYGRGNEFFIINESRNQNKTTVYVYHPEDKFVLDGCSNQADYLGENLVTGTNLLLDTNGGTQTCIDGECYAATGSTANVTFNLFETTKTLYKTCQFYLEPSSSSDEISVGLFETFKMKNQSGRFAYTSAINKDSSVIANISVGSNTQTLYTASTGVTLYIRDVVISTIPLYKRPVLNTIERNTYNQLQPDGIIHLASTYLNHVTTTFCLVRSNNQLYKNKLGKTFRRTAAGDYVCDGYKVNAAKSGLDYTSTNAGGLAGVIQGLLNVRLELIGKQDGYSLCLDATRSSTSSAFTVNVISSVGMTYVTNNYLGTVQIGEANRTITTWILNLE